VVAAILEGEILRANGDLEGAVEVLRAGADLEDTIGYDEPEPLNFSIRHWLGDTLLEAGRYAEAEEAFETELEDHPNNGWSLFGLEAALRAQGRTAEADEALERFETAWARSDTYIWRPVF
jgi:tetratricopeptide (TPR) repeat protein